MARKAVQGYTEKSYYDNTRYAGILATTDPLNEGYFKHLVNFDVSDTGQSLKPRKGFLTTAIKYNGTQIGLSDRTIIFKDNRTQLYVVYDIRYNSGYLVDFNSDMLEDKYITATELIDTIDTIDMWEFLAREIEGLATEIEEMTSEVEEPTDRAERSTIIHGGLGARLRIQDRTRVERIIDENGIDKTILKMVYAYDTTEFKFIMELYYRKDATTILGVDYPANTLMVSAVDTLSQHSYDFTQRNIASPKSIIPEVMQNVYTEHPISHVNEVGPALYVSDNDGNYYINHIYNNINYKITPYFNLDPAHVAVNSTKPEIYNYCKWAYRFDVISTKENSRIYRGPWINYNGPNTEPEIIYQFYRNREDVVYSPPEARHYKGTTFIIYIVPKTYINTTSSGVDGKPSFTDDYLEEAGSLYYQWLLPVARFSATKQTYETALRDCFKILSSSALFYIQDVTAYSIVPDNPTNTFDYMDFIGDEFNYIETTMSSSAYSKNFITGEELINRVPANANVTFKFLTCAAKDTNTYTQDGNSITKYRWYLASRQHFPNPDNPSKPFANDALLHSVYNTYNDRILNYPNYKYYRLENDKYVIGVSTNDLKTKLVKPDEDGFFDNGFILVMYLRPYNITEIQSKYGDDLELIKTAWANTPYISSTNLSYGYDKLSVTTIPLTLTKEPEDINTASDFMVFDNNYLVTWKGNTVYISEPGNYYFFKETSKITLGERVVKVIQFKTILLAFTTQHLYAIYQLNNSYQITGTKVDEEGNIKPTTETVEELVWARQIVLYNILTSHKYADLIQVFNQMVLFYSEDGQLFLIKPSTTIDDETRFSLQYFNKAANDILANYDVYINERLEQYGIDVRITKDLVQIKGLVSVNYIKIFYYVPGVITYILIYDVLNNRYYVYDTLTFTDINDKMFIENGEMYTTVQNSKMYFTYPYVELYKQDTSTDMSVYDNFQKQPIVGLIDTGNLNLNNHLMKRFRDLQVTYKNINATSLVFNVETLLDDVIVKPYYNNVLEVRESNGVSTYVPTKVYNSYDLITSGSAVQTNTLLDFSKYTSNKLITHKTSIVSMGKVIRLKMLFISRGTYKIQAYGIIYKERRV